MPKEVVQYPNTDRFSGTEMSIHWDKDCAFVQIGLTRHVWGDVNPDSPVSPVHADHHHCHECAVVAERNAKLRAEGLPEIMCDSTSSPAPAVGEFEQPATVFTEVLSRNEINKMIRVLRRARDQAYGEDA